MLADAWTLPRTHVCIDSHTYAFSRMNVLTCGSTVSRMEWLFQLCFLTHEPSHLWIYLLTYRLTLSPMLSHAWAFWLTNLTSHVWIDSLTYAFSDMSLSPMSLPSHVWIDSLTYAFSCMRVLTYGSTFSRMDWLSYQCSLTHEPFHLLICFLTYGLTLSPMLSHAWAFTPMNLPSHVWIDSLTCFYHAWAFPPMDLFSYVCIDTLTYAFSRMSLFASESTFSLMHWLSYQRFWTHEPLHLWIYLLTYGLTLSPLLSHA